MVTPSETCVRRDACVQNGKGLVHIKELTDRAGLLGHGRIFNHIVVDPGCSIGYHEHHGETEFYYILKGEGSFSDNGRECTVRAGDVCATPDGEGHSLENTGTEPLEVIALIVLE